VSNLRGIIISNKYKEATNLAKLNEKGSEVKSEPFNNLANEEVKMTYLFFNIRNTAYYNKLFR
jgi:hypothetical protein